MFDSDSTTQITNRFNKLVSGSTLNFAGIKSISFDYARDLSWTVQPLPFHPNGIRLTAFDDQGDILSSELYYSIGGGFVVQEATVKADLVEQGGMAANVGKERKSWPFPYHDASSLELHANENGLTIAQVVWANETSVDASDAVDRQIKDIWKVMTSCIEEGIKSGELIGWRRKRTKTEDQRPKTSNWLVVGSSGSEPDHMSLYIRRTSPSRFTQS